MTLPKMSIVSAILGQAMQEALGRNSWVATFLAVVENDLSGSMAPDSGDSWTPRAGVHTAGIIMPGLRGT
jgi:hypothetical protein